MGFDYRELRAFVAIAEYGSLGRAAAVVHISQPGLSRILAALENRLSQRLFERAAKGMLLTAAGETFLPHAKLLLFESQQAEESLDALRGLRRGRIRVGAVAAVARSILPQAVALLLQTVPGLKIELLERPDDQLLAALLGRDIDLMICAAVPTHEDISLVAECRYGDVYAAYCRSHHPLPKRGGVSLQRVLAEHWVMPPVGTTPRQLFEETIARHGESPPDVAMETGSLDAMTAFVAHTNLLGWLPRPLLAHIEAAGRIRILEVKELAVSRRFFVYRRSRGLLPSAVLPLLDALPLVSRADR